MTYGIALRNAAGENLVDVTEGFTYYHKSSGVCINPALDFTFGSSSGPFPLIYDNGTYQLYDNRVFPSSADGGVYLMPSPSNAVGMFDYTFSHNFAGTGWGNIYVWYTYQNITEKHWYPSPVTSNFNDILFFEVPPAGLVNLRTLPFYFTGPDRYGNTIPTGLTGVAIPHLDHTGGPLSYKVVSTDLPPQQDGNVGVAVYSENGNLQFDTTRDIASFVDHVFLTKAEVKNLIDNNLSLTFTLRKNVSNMFLSCDGMSSYWRERNNDTERYRHLVFKQTASNQVTVSRGEIVNVVGANSYPYSLYENYVDCLFLIGDFD